MQKTGSSTERPYSAALDGVRFFSFFAVFLDHNVDLTEHPLFGYGFYGVTVFFVLSGFLIGGILLDLADRSEIPLGQRLKLFYMRRALRIFPLYYLVLFCIYLFPFLGMKFLGSRDSLLWHATYTLNFAEYYGMPDHSNPTFDGFHQNHFWSLCVEEHFYMLAPLAILTLSLLRSQQLFVLIWIGVAAARLWFGLHNNLATEQLSPMQFDCLTMGMAAAFIQKRGAFLGVTRPTAVKIGIAAAVLTLCILAYNLRMNSRLSQLLFMTFFQTTFCIAVSVFLLQLWNGRCGVVNQFFSLAPFVYLGKISYGLYIYHELVHYAIPPLIDVEHYPVAYRFDVLMFTIFVSMFSWQFFEHPINELKRHFPYPSRSRGAVRTS